MLPWKRTPRSCITMSGSTCYGKTDGTLWWAMEVTGKEHGSGLISGDESTPLEMDSKSKLHRARYRKCHFECGDKITESDQMDKFHLRKNFHQICGTLGQVLHHSGEKQSGLTSSSVGRSVDQESSGDSRQNLGISMPTITWQKSFSGSWRETEGFGLIVSLISLTKQSQSLWQVFVFEAIWRLAKVGIKNNH